MEFAYMSSTEKSLFFSFCVKYDPALSNKTIQHKKPFVMLMSNHIWVEPVLDSGSGGVVVKAYFFFTFSHLVAVT